MALKKAGPKVEVKGETSRFIVSGAKPDGNEVPG